MPRSGSASSWARRRCGSRSRKRGRWASGWSRFTTAGTSAPSAISRCRRPCRTWSACASRLPGWVTDKDGNPIMEEKPIFDRDDFFQAPLGGTREQGSHKGYGFALMAEVLSTMLAGALPTMLAPGSGSKNQFAAYNIEAFTDLGRFKDSMDEMLRTLRTAAPAPGQERVLYPGLSEAEELAHRRAHGIPLHKEVIEWFGDCTNEMSLPPLAISP